MTQQHNHWVVIGKLGRVHGIQGFIHVQAHSGDVEALLSYKQWYGKINDTWVPLKRVEEKIDLQQRGFVKIDGYTSREQAALLTHTLIGIQERDLPTLSDDEYYCFELIGMDVVNTHQVHLGKVTQFLETGANDVIVVEGDGQRHLIPYLWDRVVQSVSREQQQIVVAWDGDFL